MAHPHMCTHKVRDRNTKHKYEPSINQVEQNPAWLLFLEVREEVERGRASWDQVVRSSIHQAQLGLDADGLAQSKREFDEFAQDPGNLRAMDMFIEVYLEEEACRGSSGPGGGAGGAGGAAGTSDSGGARTRSGTGAKDSGGARTRSARSGVGTSGGGRSARQESANADAESDEKVSRMHALVDS